VSDPDGYFCRPRISLSAFPFEYPLFYSVDLIAVQGSNRGRRHESTDTLYPLEQQAVKRIAGNDDPRRRGERGVTCQIEITRLIRAVVTAGIIAALLE